MTVTDAAVSAKLVLVRLPPSRARLDTEVAAPNVTAVFTIKPEVNATD